MNKNTAPAITPVPPARVLTVAWSTTGNLRGQAEEFELAAEEALAAAKVLAEAEQTTWLFMTLEAAQDAVDALYRLHAAAPQDATLGDIEIVCHSVTMAEKWRDEIRALYDELSEHLACRQFDC